MIRDQEVLDELRSLRKKTQLLANPLYNDAGGAALYSKIDASLKKVEELLVKDKETYKW